jgi:proline iminopeptidase
VFIEHSRFLKNLKGGLHKIMKFFVYLLILFSLVYCQKKDHKERRRQIPVASLLLLSSQNQGLPFSEGTVKTSDGTTLYYKTVGLGKPLFILHGGSGLDHNYLLPHFQNLLAADHRLIFFDQRGTGQSLLATEPSPDSITISKFLSDIDDIRKELKLSKVNLLGHSWGSHLALQYAIHPSYSANVNSLILVSSMGANYNYYNVLLANLVAKNLDLTEFIKRKTELTLQKTPATAKAYYEYLFSFYFKDPANLTKLNLTFSDNTAKNTLLVASYIDLSLPLDNPTGLNATGSFDLNLSNITVPVLLLHGKEDVIPIEYTMKATESNSILNKLTSTIPVIVPIANCGHFPFIEQPEVFSHSIRNFTATLPEQ